MLHIKLGVSFGVSPHTPRRDTPNAPSEFGVKAAKPKEKSYKLADSGGLYLLAQPNGSKLWRLKYRYAEKEQALEVCREACVRSGHMRPG